MALPHPAHGPIEALPRDGDGFIPGYYFRSPQEIEAEGLELPACARPSARSARRRALPPPSSSPDRPSFSTGEPGIAPVGAVSAEGAGRALRPIGAGEGGGNGADEGETVRSEADDAPLPGLRRARLDGFDPARQRAFLTVLAESGSVQQACEAVGIARSTAYRLRTLPEAQSFRVGWEEAMAQGVRVLADTALARAIDGIEEPVFWKGEMVGTRRRYNDRLLMFLLKHRWLYAPAAAPDPTRMHEREAVHSLAGLAGALDRIAPPPAVPGAEPDRTAPAGPRLRTLD